VNCFLSLKIGPCCKRSLMRTIHDAMLLFRAECVSSILQHWELWWWLTLLKYKFWARLWWSKTKKGWSQFSPQSCYFFTSSVSWLFSLHFLPFDSLKSKYIQKLELGLLRCSPPLCLPYVEIVGNTSQWEVGVTFSQWNKGGGYDRVIRGPPQFKGEEAGHGLKWATDRWLQWLVDWPASCYIKSAAIIIGMIRKSPGAVAKVVDFGHIVKFSLLWAQFKN